MQAGGDQECSLAERRSEIGRGRARRDANVRRWAASGGATGFAAGKKDAWKKFAVLVLVEPGTFDVEELDAGEAGERKRIDCELGDRLVRPRIGLVVQNVDGAVPDLEKIDVTGNRAWGAGLGC